MRLFERPISSLALIAALAVALALGGCGRKSGLDLPPSASVTPAPGAAVAAEAKATASAPAFPVMRAHRPAPNVVPKRDLPIDILLN
jgi:predicted small lipoprotein YifL